MDQVQVLFSTTVNPNGYAANLQFFVGTDEANLSPMGDVIYCGNGKEFLPQSLQLPLDEETGYFVKGIVTSEGGVTSSDVIAFTTPSASGLPVLPSITPIIVTFP